MLCELLQLERKQAGRWACGLEHDNKPLVYGIVHFTYCDAILVHAFLSNSVEGVAGFNDTKYK